MNNNLSVPSDYNLSVPSDSCPLRLLRLSPQTQLTRDDVIACLQYANRIAQTHAMLPLAS